MENTMGNNKAPQVTIDGQEYDLDTFSQEEKMLLEHCVDLDRKMNSCQFQLDQLRVGKEAFLSMLKQSLGKNDGERGGSSSEHS
jgi:hypothetical protein